MRQLTPHFSLDELTHSAKADALGLDNTPTPEAEDNLLGTAEMLEHIRAHLNDQRGLPVSIIVSSGYRSPAVNKAVGSKPTSDHIKGKAADIQAPAYGTPHDVALALQPFLNELGIGQLILEGVGGKTWVHVSTEVPARAINRVLTITDAGQFAGLQAVA